MYLSLSLYMCLSNLFFYLFSYICLSNLIFCLPRSSTVLAETETRGTLLRLAVLITRILTPEPYK